jgi:preprotein translocase subunit SecD
MDRGWYIRFGFFASLLVVATLALWPSLDTWVPAPRWVKKTFTGRIAPGLDIRGGLRLAYEVEVEEAIRDIRDRRADQLSDELCRALGVCSEDEPITREQREQLRQKVTVRSAGDRGLTATFVNAADAAKLDAALVERLADVRESSRDGRVVTLELRADRLENIRDLAVEQAKQTVSNRIDELGLRETSITSRDNDIIIEIPGADESAFNRIRAIVSQTARLEFKIVDDDSEYVAGLSDLPEGITRSSEQVSAGTSKPSVVVQYLVAEGEGSREKLAAYVATLEAAEGFPEGRTLAVGKLEREEPRRSSKNRNGAAASTEAWRTYLLYSRADVSGEMIDDAFVANDPQTQKPYVSLQFKPGNAGADVFERLTGQNVKRRFAIVLDDRVESAPVIQTRIGGGRAQITLGGMRDYQTVMNEARDLVVVLKAGALPAPIRPSNEQLIGPTLGRDAIAQAGIGGLVSILLVAIFMAVYYQLGGVIADVMVTANVLFLLATIAFFEGTLTLPGVAGIALTVGMSVDANVLINERIREELRAGKSPRSAVEQGFSRAFQAIFDGQFTTMLSAIVLFQYGTGPIKGFAVTLGIGVLISIFTGVFCSRIAFDWLVRGLRVQNLRIG